MPKQIKIWNMKLKKYKFFLIKKQINFYLVLCYGPNIFFLTFRKYKEKKEMVTYGMIYF
jgi:hypothetical protein